MPGSPDALKRADKASGTSIVFLGAFNPAIFQPAWFQRYGLLADDPDAAEVQAITPQVTSWKQDWLRVVVQPEKCDFEASEDVASVRALLDVANGAFSLLPHVPIQAFGINRYVHFQMENEAAWHKLGFGLFNADLWADVVDDARLKTLQVESRRPEKPQDVLTATVQPSAQFKNAVFVTTNDHYDIGEDADADAALSRLGEVFDESLEHASRIIDHIRAF